jgi:HSP20 family protein
MTLIKRKHEHNPGFWFNDFFGKDFLDFAPVQSFGKTVPAVNIKETETDFKIEVAAPGLKKEDISVELENGVLSISAESKTEKEESDQEGRYTRKEFSYSSFKRSFSVNEESVDAEKIEGKYENGVLKLVLPKKAKSEPEKKSKTISIA